MADGLGLVASILAVIQITEKVTTYCYYYIGAVKNAPTEIANLCKELELFKEILQQLEHQVGGTGTQPPTTPALTGLKELLQKCCAEITTLQLKLQPRTRTRLSKILSRCTWPLKATETTNIISQLERYKSLFQLASTSDQLFLSRVIQLFTQETNVAVADLVQVVEKEFETQRLRRQEEDSRRLAGAGKTFLSSLVIDELEHRAIQTPTRGVAYIYFNYKQQDDQAPTNVVSSLIKQLWTGSPALAASLPKDIEALHEEYRLQDFSKRPTLAELEDVLNATIKLFTSVFFVFDALDECHEEKQRNQLLPLFHRLVSEGASIFLTSRPYPHDIKISLSSNPNSIAKIELSAKEEDVITYVKAKIAGNAHASSLIDGRLREDVISALVSSCKGMFLLVHFYIEHLCQHTTKNQIRKALKELNASLAAGTESALDETYTRAITNIRRQHPARTTLAFKILAWLVKARRPLAVGELRNGVVIEPDMYDLDDDDLPADGMLLEVCGGLAIINEKSAVIELAHYSVQEYLEGNPLIQESLKFEFEIMVGCINLFWLGLFKSQVRSGSEPFDCAPLLGYAANHIHTHVKSCHEDMSADVVIRFLRKPILVYFYFDVVCLLTDKLELPEPLGSPLHAASYWGHVTAISTLIDEGASIDSRAKYGSTALHYAARGGNVDAARILLENGANIDAHSVVYNRALHDAAQRGHVDVVRLLLEKGADTEVENYGGLTPLNLAAIHRQLDVALLLLGHGINQPFNQPLEMFAWTFHKALVSLILHKIEDVFARADELGGRAVLDGVERALHVYADILGCTNVRGQNILEGIRRGLEEARGLYDNQSPEELPTNYMVNF